MPRFSVGIRGEDLERATAVLNGANIPTIGSSAAWRDQPRGTGPAGLPKVETLRAILFDAQTAEEASARVMQYLPAGYEVEEPEQIP
jgi:hypothetical protein